MMYWNLVWIWSHPEVYVLILPAFGIYSEITSTFTGKLLLAVPPTDFVLHNSLFLVARFHNAIIGGVVFGMLAGITY